MTSDFMSNYDENLMENVFFQTLQTEYSELFSKAIREGCIICVPRVGSLPKYLLTLEAFLSNVLVPGDELPETHFQTLSGAVVKISNQIITIDHEVGRQSNIHILFHETFYTNDGLKYEVLCVEQPLDGRVSSGCNRVIVLNNLKDCIDFLWTESGSHEVIEKLDKEISEFLKNNVNIDTNSLQEITDTVGSLYIKCIQIILKNNNLKKKCELEKHLINNFKIAVETYMQHRIYKKIMKGITTCTAFDDAQLNKLIRNFSEIHFKDLRINSKYHMSIPIARLELSRINGFSTTLGKIGCLKRSVNALSESQINKTVLNTEDLLQVLSFLVIKTNLPNWNAQLKFLELFQFSSSSKIDEDNYLITSLEAAITYVQSGITFVSNTPDSILDIKDDFKCSDLYYFKKVSEKACTKKKTINHFFQQIAVGNLNEVKTILEVENNNISDYSTLNLCHPLCTCEKCSYKIYKNICDTAPTIKSCNDQGLTALHIASMYGVPNLVEYLLAKKADPNASDCDGRTPLHYAALRGHQNALLLLIHNNADFNVEDNLCNTPLHLCSNNGHESCVKALIYFSEYLGIKLKINHQNIKGDTSLHNASKWGYLNIVKILLEYGASSTILNKRKFSPIDYAHNVKVSQLLKENCQNVKNYVRIKPFCPVFDLEEQVSEKQKNNFVKGYKPNSVDMMKKVEKVLYAIENGDINLVCFYMGIDMTEFKKDSFILKELEDEKSNTAIKCHPLCGCSVCLSDREQSQNSNITKSFKIKGLNINICDTNGYTPLHIASKKGHLELVRIFIQKGVLLDVQTFSQLQTPLMLACQNQKLEVVKILLDSGCKIDMQDCNLNTALHYACQTGNVKLVETLLKYEPNVNLKNENNKTPLQEARENVYVGIINVLKGGKPLDLNGF